MCPGITRKHEAQDFAQAENVALDRVSFLAGGQAFWRHVALHTHHQGRLIDPLLVHDSCKAEIGHLYHACILADENVFGMKVFMENVMFLVRIADACADSQEHLQFLRRAEAEPALVHKNLKVGPLHEFHFDVLLALGHPRLVEPHDVVMVTQLGQDFSFAA